MLEVPKETVKKVLPSPMPFLGVGIIWVIGTFFLKMYKFSSYLILAVIGVIAYFILRKFVFPDQETEVEIETPRSYFSQVQQQFIEDGTKSLNNIIALNKEIYKPELNADVDDLVNTTDKILDYVYEHEKAATSLRKLVYYYLPTVEKLLGRYNDVEDENELQNVVESKGKVENIIKTTTTAFKNQLNSLFDTDTLDINSEVKVLEKIYVQEGLIDLEEINKEK